MDSYKRFSWSTKTESLYQGVGYKPILQLIELNTIELQNVLSEDSSKLCSYYSWKIQKAKLIIFPAFKIHITIWIRLIQPSPWWKGHKWHNSDNSEQCKCPIPRLRMQIADSLWWLPFNLEIITQLWLRQLQLVDFGRKWETKILINLCYGYSTVIY